MQITIKAICVYNEDDAYQNIDLANIVKMQGLEFNPRQSLGILYICINARYNNMLPEIVLQCMLYRMFGMKVPSILSSYFQSGYQFTYLNMERRERKLLLFPPHRNQQLYDMKVFKQTPTLCTWFLVYMTWCKRCKIVRHAVRTQFWFSLLNV